MLTSMRKRIVVALAVTTALGLWADRAEAGPFLDWLLGRDVYVYPGPVATAPSLVPPAVVAEPQITMNYAPAYQTLAPVPVAQPVTVARPVVATFPWSPQAVAAPQPVVVGYAPYAPNYRTVWNRVPVTAYRVVTSYNVSGYPVAVGQPCNTYTWQAQRVPTLFGGNWWPFRSPAVYGAYPAPTATMYAPGTAPYYPAAPAATMAAPATAPCINCVPSTTVSPSVDSSAVPYEGPVPASGVAPYPGIDATTVPQLSPGTVPQAADQAPTLAPSTETEAPALQPAAPMNSSAQSSNSSEWSTPAGSASTRNESTSPYRVTPIPAPDVRAYPSEQSAPKAPPLLNGRDRTAFDTSSTRVERASWNAVHPVAKVQHSPGSSPVRNVPLWNDNGWRN